MRVVPRVDSALASGAQHLLMWGEATEERGQSLQVVRETAGRGGRLTWWRGETPGRHKGVHTHLDGMAYCSS